MHSRTGSSYSNPVKKLKRPRILFVYSKPTRFVRIDMELLSGNFDVREWYQRTRTVNVLALAQAVLSSDMVFGWFASWHTFFPAILARWLNRPLILVIGGYDTAKMEEIQYGSQRGGIHRWITRKVMQSASCLVTHSLFTKREAIENAGAIPDKVSVLYLGVKPPFSKGQARKRLLVMTVGNVDICNLQRKGLEPFVRAAAVLPDVPFVVVGKWLDRSIDKLRLIASPNVQFAGEVSDEELARYYQEATVYVQASSHEGFGLSLAEAMLAECIPVVTSVGSLPEVVGDAGLYVDSVAPETLSQGIRKALSLDQEYGKRARARILQEFPLERRQRGLCELIERVIRA